LLLAAGIVLAGLNLRIAVASVPPVIDEIEEDLGLSSGVGGLLTSLPVLCFGLVAMAAPGLTRRLGAERTLLAALVPLTVGILLRADASVAALFAGTVLAGAGIAVANVVVPAIVKARFEEWTGVLMGVYVASLGAGAAVAAGLTAPLANALDGRWNVALAVWAAPAAIALVVLVPGVLRGGTTFGNPAGSTRALLRDRLAWQVTLFFGTQSLLFYAGLAWLPSILRDEGYSAESAGTALALYALIGIPPSLVVPVLAARMHDQRVLVVIATAFEVAAIAGLLLAPDVAFLWVACFAVGQGAAFSLALTLMVLRAPDSDRAASLSALAQSVGYTIAAAGPFLLGALHDATDGWGAPLATMLALTAALLAAGLGAGRPGLVGVR
jgi:MFS transporter, CP family, cyanate transporter